MRELSKQVLFEQFSGGRLRALEILYQDPQVEALVLLKANDDNVFKIVPIGPRTGCKRIKDATLFSDDLFSPVGYALTEKALVSRAAASASARTRFSGNVDTVYGEQEYKKRIAQLTGEVDELRSGLLKYKKRVKEKDELILGLSRRFEKAKTFDDEEGASKSDLTAREAGIREGEDELISRLAELMKKEAEIEQREKRILLRKRSFYEKEDSNTSRENTA